MIVSVPVWMSASIIVSMVMIAALVWTGFYLLSRLPASSAGRKAVAALMAGIFLTAWLLCALILGMDGFFRPDPSVRIPNILFSLLPLVIGFGLLFVSPTFREIVEATPPQWIIGVQTYRVLGVFFLILYAQEKLPGVFALPAGVGDLIIGMTAPIVAWLYVLKRRWARSLAILWNIAGIADLVMAVALGFLSSPGRYQRLALDSPNDLITAFPLVLIPTFAVPLSNLMHLLSLRGLLGSKNNRRATNDNDKEDEDSEHRLPRPRSGRPFAA